MKLKFWSIQIYFKQIIILLKITSKISLTFVFQVRAKSFCHWIQFFEILFGWILHCSLKKGSSWKVQWFILLNNFCIFFNLKFVKISKNFQSFCIFCIIFQQISTNFICPPPPHHHHCSPTRGWNKKKISLCK